MIPMRILMMVTCASVSFGMKLDNEDDDLPVLSTKTVLNYVTNMMNSPREMFKEIAKDTLQNLKSQMDDKSKQYAKLTINGIKFAVNMGAKGSALRSENEALFWQLWNVLMSILYNVLSWFGFGDKHIDESYKKELQDSDDYYVEDAIFMKTALQHQLCEIEEILHYKYIMTKHVEDNSISISQPVLAKIKKENFFELQYKNRLENGIDLLSKMIKAVDDEVEAEKRKESQN